ncbi:MAG: histidine phosphatase family protein [Firmicutes bacterium]|nr:histidine phosphatase family protein [Bacillota bacterium]
MKKRLIYLIRHAEPLKDRVRNYFIRCNPPLSPYGIKQAETLALALSGRKLESVYCSDLRCAKETAAIIAARQSVKPKAFIGLREIRWGEWENLTPAELKEKIEISKELGQDSLEFNPPGGESLAEVIDRVIPVFTQITEQTNGNIAIVAHAVVNLVIQCHLLQQDLALEHLFTSAQAYAQVSVIQQSSSIFRIGEANLYKQLEPQGAVLH